MRATIIIITIFVFSAFKANAISHRDVSLKELILKSDYIFYGVVTDTTVFESPIKIPNHREYESSHFVRRKATIQILHEFKSNSDSEVIQVGYSRGAKLENPGYYIGDTVLTFLKFNENENFYLTISPWSGTRRINNEIFKVYSARINELLETAPLIGKDNFVHDWLVKCAGDKYLAWDGAVELKREFIYVNYKNKEKIKTNLSDKQKLKLKESLFSFGIFDYDYIELLDLVVSYGHFDGLKDYCLENIKNIDETEFWLKVYLMEAVYAVEPKGKYKRILKRLDKTTWIDDRSKKREKQKQLIDKFILEAEKS